MTLLFSLFYYPILPYNAYICAAGVVSLLASPFALFVHKRHAPPTRMASRLLLHPHTHYC